MSYEIRSNTHYVNVLFRLLSVINNFDINQCQDGLCYANQLTILVRRQFSFKSHSIFSLVAIYAHHVFAVQSI